MSETKDTQERILDSACRLFAEKGYRETTVHEICDAADANVAAVNYYYRSKESLYREVWVRSRELQEAEYPPPTVAGDPEIWLRELIRVRISSTFDAGPAGWFPRILHWEMSSPTEMAPELKAEFLRPHIMAIKHNVREMVGSEASDFQVSVCTTHIVGLFAFLNMRRFRRARATSSKAPISKELRALTDGDSADPNALALLISQTQEFAIAAVHGVAASVAKGPIL